MGWPGTFLCLRRLPAPTPIPVPLAGDRRPPRPRPESSVRAVRPLAVSLPGGPGPRDHCRALGEQPALCRALGTPRRVRSSDDRLRVPKLTLHLVGMSRRGLPSASSAATRPPGIGQHGTVLERAPGIEALHL